MAFIISRIVNNLQIRILEEKIIALSLQCPNTVQTRNRQGPPLPKLRNPTWFTKKNRTVHNDFVTADNQSFIKEVIEDRYKYPPKVDLPENTIEWKPNMKRTGVIARKIGDVPIWLKTGKRVLTTMLQVLDNHVIKYYSPEEYNPPMKRPTIVKRKSACLIVGAESTDPSLFTKEYCGLFKDSGVMPKKHLARFFISPDAYLPPGTPLSSLHFSIGNYIDVRGKTIGRGFQGVMKRHGFSGMPASHGVTKTHRRGGNIGGGGAKGRVWPGTKMPGHMGLRYRYAKGLKIWRINTKHNVLWVTGSGIPGGTNSIVYIYDTNLPLRKPTKPLPFPTYLNVDNNDIEEEIYDESVHQFDDPTIVYTEDVKK